MAVKIREETAQREAIQAQLDKTTGALHTAAQQFEAELKQKQLELTTKSKQVARLKEELQEADLGKAELSKNMHAKVNALKNHLASLEVKQSEERTINKLKISKLTHQLEQAKLDLSFLRSSMTRGEQLMSNSLSGQANVAAAGLSGQEGSSLQVESPRPSLAPMHPIDDALDMDDVQRLMHQRQRHMLMQRQVASQRTTHRFLLEKEARSRQLLEQRVDKMTNEIHEKDIEVAKVREECRAQVSHLRSTFMSAIQDIVDDRDGAVQRLLGAEREELSLLRVQLKSCEGELLRSAAEIRTFRHDAASERALHEKERKQLGQRLELMHNTLMALTDAFHIVDKLHAAKTSKQGRKIEHALNQLSLLPDKKALLTLSPEKIKEELSDVGLLTPEPDDGHRRKSFVTRWL